MNHDPDPSVRHYERASNEARHRLSSNLDALAAALTPGRMLDEVLTYARAGGGDFLKGLGRAASDNPIPALLMGVGAAMFISGKGRLGTGKGETNGAEPSTVHANGFGTSPDDRSGIGAKVGDALSSLRGGAAEVGDRVARTAETVAGTVTSAAAKVGDAAASAGAAVSESATSAAESVRDYATGVRDTAVSESDEMLRRSGQLMQELRDRGEALAREQPLVVAAIGLALGAAAAALLPRTQTEDALMGEASDAVKGVVGAVASEQFEKAKSVADKVVEEVKSTAEREGLTPAAAGDAVRAVADKLAAATPSSAWDERPPAG